jgi:hypothetical protein
MFIFNEKRSIFCYILILGFYVLSFYILYIGEIEIFTANKKVIKLNKIKFNKKFIYRKE